MLALVLCVARGWDAQVSEVNVGGVMEHIRLGTTQDAAIEANSKARTANGGCASIMETPAKDPAWRIQVEKILASDLHSRVEDQGKKQAEIVVPRCFAPVNFITT